MKKIKLSALEYPATGEHRCSDCRTMIKKEDGEERKVVSGGQVRYYHMDVSKCSEYKKISRS